MSDCGRCKARVVGWRAWYDGDRVFDSREITWEALPEDGMLRVILYHEEQNGSGQHRRTIHDAKDYYWKADGDRDAIYASGSGPAEDIASRYRNPSIKRGRWTDAVTMDKMDKESLEYRWP